MKKLLSKARLIATTQNSSVLFLLNPKHISAFGYAPFGHITTEDEKALLGFNGRVREAETGTYILGNGYRTFSPTTRRFTSPDNLSPFDNGGINGYVYCNADPINKTDPTGHIGGWTFVRKNLKRIAQHAPTNKVFGNPLLTEKIIGNLDIRSLLNFSSTSKRLRTTITNSPQGRVLDKIKSTKLSRQVESFSSTSTMSESGSSSSLNSIYSPFDETRDILDDLSRTAQPGTFKNAADRLKKIEDEMGFDRFLAKIRREEIRVLTLPRANHGSRSASVAYTSPAPRVRNIRRPSL